MPAPDSAVSAAAVDEMMHLYNGWLAYLLRRLGVSAMRVERAELEQALAQLSCRVEREGNAYVIRMEDGERGETDDGEVGSADGACE